MSDWFQTGEQAIDKSFADHQEDMARRSVRRVWMKPATAIEVVALDEEFFTFWEHQLQIGERWDNFYTCLRNKNAPCPLCEAGFESKLTTVFTVIDCNRWEDKQGKVHQYEKKILPVKVNTAKMLKDKKSSWGGLKGKAIRIHRKGPKDAATGSDFELVMKDGKIVEVRMDALAKKLPPNTDLNPYDYRTLFYPKTYEDLRIQVARARQSDSVGRSVSTSGASSFDGPSDMGAPPPTDGAPPSIETDQIPF